ERAPLATQLGQTLASLREPLLGLAPRAFGRERPLARELGGALGLAGLRGGTPQLALRRAEALARVALLPGESAQALLVVGDPLLGGGDLLVERVAEAHQG